MGSKVTASGQFTIDPKVPTDENWYSKLKPAAKSEWHGVQVRPADDAPGWVSQDHFSPLMGHYSMRSYTDPETGQIWKDHPPLTSPDKEFYWIAAGCPNTTAPAHNAAWYTAQSINETFTPVGMARVRDYPGKYLLTDPKGWPEPWRSLFAKGHPKWVVKK